jgi:hypothetical protein
MEAEARLQSAWGKLIGGEWGEAHHSQEEESDINP